MSWRWNVVKALLSTYRHYLPRHVMFCIFVYMSTSRFYLCLIYVIYVIYFSLSLHIHYSYSYIFIKTETLVFFLLFCLTFSFKVLLKAFAKFIPNLSLGLLLKVLLIKKCVIWIYVGNIESFDEIASWNDASGLFQLLAHLNTEAYLWPYQASMMKLFCENSQLISAVNYFYKTSPS